MLEALAEELGIKKKRKKKTETAISTSLQRIRLTHPKLDPIHQWMASAPEIERLLANAPQQEILLGSLLEAANYLVKNNRPITLSKLGSMFFNNSKILRNKNAVPHHLLGGMMLQLLEIEDCPENRKIALQQFGVINNPATSTAAFYGPLTFIRNGQPDPWIADRHRKGELVNFNSTNLEHIDAIQLPDGINTIITSENAAPFHELIQEKHHSPILYTGGYPNAVVCRLLDLFKQAGITCKHWGDSDPDGLLIAALIDRHIPTSLFRCTIDDVLRHSNDLISLQGNSIRLGQSLLKTHPNFKFQEELKLTLRMGHWLEQERWRPTQ
jgi:hypothetical protein